MGPDEKRLIVSGGLTASFWVLLVGIKLAFPNMIVPFEWALGLICLGMVGLFATLIFAVQAYRSKAEVPSPRQVQPIASGKRATDSLLEEYDRLSRWAESDARVGNAAKILGPIKDRNADLANALGYALHADWERTVGYGIILSGRGALDHTVEKFRLAAEAGDIRAWGRRELGGLYELIEPGFWSDNTVDLAALRSFMGHAQTVPFEGVTTDRRFYNIMVNRAEVEGVWPHAG